MEDSIFSEDFCSFIGSAIPSVSAAEVLLLLFKHPTQWWTVSDLLRGLPSDVNITESEASRCLEILRSRGLVETVDEKRVRYRAGAAALDAQVRTLAQAYDQRPVTLIRMTLRDSNIRSFADAFKFWKR